LFNQGPGLNTQGFLFCKGRKMNSIDFSKLNEQIVKQAFAKWVLTDEQKQRLFKDKIDRAKELVEARKPFQATTQY
jgi:hypothetical protein